MPKPYWDNTPSLYEQKNQSGWPGTQDPNQKSAIEYEKPQYPPCRGAADRQFQFADESGGAAYVTTKYDRWNNEIPTGNLQIEHNSGAVGDAGQWGNLQHASGSDTAGATPDDFSGFNVIEYGQGAGFPSGPTVTIVDTSRSDRGRES